MIRTSLIAVSLSTAALAFTAGTANAGPSVSVQIGSSYPSVAVMPVQDGPPPPPRYERVPAPRRGMIWSQGHWEWRGHRHVWVPGNWVRVRSGYSYHQPAWVQRGNQWHYAQGGWDRDRDGIPNRYDRRPNNPYRQ